MQLGTFKLLFIFIRTVLVVVLDAITVALD